MYTNPVFANQHQVAPRGYRPLPQQLVPNGHGHIPICGPPPPMLQHIYHEPQQAVMEAPNKPVYAVQPMNNKLIQHSITGPCANYSQEYFQPETYPNPLVGPNLSSKIVNDQNSATSAAPGRDSPCNARAPPTLTLHPMDAEKGSPQPELQELTPVRTSTMNSITSGDIQQEHPVALFGANAPEIGNFSSCLPAPPALAHGESPAPSQQIPEPPKENGSSSPALDEASTSTIKSEIKDDCSSAKSLDKREEAVISREVTAPKSPPVEENNESCGSQLPVLDKTLCVQLVPLKITSEIAGTKKPSNPSDHSKVSGASVNPARRARKSVSRPASEFLHYLSWRDADVAVGALTDYVPPERVKKRMRHEKLKQLTRKKRLVKAAAAEKKTQSEKGPSLKESVFRKSPRIVEKHLMEVLVKTRLEMTESDTAKLQEEESVEKESPISEAKGCASQSEIVEQTTVLNEDTAIDGTTADSPNCDRKNNIPGADVGKTELATVEDANERINDGIESARDAQMNIAENTNMETIEDTNETTKMDTAEDTKVDTTKETKEDTEGNTAEHIKGDTTEDTEGESMEDTTTETMDDTKGDTAEETINEEETEKEKEEEREERSPSTSDESLELGSGATERTDTSSSSEKYCANLEKQTPEKWNRITNIIAEVCAPVLSPSEDVAMRKDAESHDESRDLDEVSEVAKQQGSRQLAQTADQAVTDDSITPFIPAPPYPTTDNNITKDTCLPTSSSHHSEASRDSTAFSLLKGGTLEESRDSPHKKSEEATETEGERTKEPQSDLHSEKEDTPSNLLDETSEENKAEENKPDTNLHLINSSSLINPDTSSAADTGKEPSDSDSLRPTPTSELAPRPISPLPQTVPTPENSNRESPDPEIQHIPSEEASDKRTQNLKILDSEVPGHNSDSDVLIQDSDYRPSSVPPLPLRTLASKVKKRKLEETLSKIQFRRHSSVIVEKSKNWEKDEEATTEESDDLYLRKWLKSAEDTGQTVVGTSLAAALSPAASCQSEPWTFPLRRHHSEENLSSESGLLLKIPPVNNSTSSVADPGLTLPIRSFSTNQEVNGSVKGKESRALSILTTDISLTAIAKSVGISPDIPSTSANTLPQTSPISSPESPNDSQDTGAEKMIAHHNEPPSLWPHSSSLQVNSLTESAEPHSKLPTIAAESVDGQIPVPTTGALAYGGPLVPLVPRPRPSKESRSSSLSSSPPPPLVLGPSHLAHTIPSLSLPRSTYAGSSRPSSATSVISTGRTLTPQGRVEISIVGSPEVFGAGPTVSSAQISRSVSEEVQGGEPGVKRTPPILTIDEDERVIERCEQQMEQKPRDIGSIVQGTSLNNSLCLPTTGNNPEIAMMPLSPGLGEAQEAREASNISRHSLASSGSPTGGSEEATVKRRGSFSTGSQPPPKKRFILSLESSDESHNHDTLSGMQIHDGRVDRGVGSDDPEIVIDDAQEPVPKKSDRPDSTDTVAYEIRPYCPKTQDAQTSTTVGTSPKREAPPPGPSPPKTEPYIRHTPNHQSPNTTGTTQYDPRAMVPHSRSIFQNGPVPVQPGPRHPTIRSALEQQRHHSQWMHQRPPGMAYQPPGTIGVTRPMRPVRPQTSAVSQMSQQRMKAPVGVPVPQQPHQHQSQPSSQVGSAQNQSNGENLTHYRLIQEIKQLPHGEQFQAALNNWEWVLLDSVRLPSVYRGNSEKFVAVHMVQMRLLSKFPPNVPGEIMRRHTMVSHKMTVLESWIFNTVNALQCRFEFGCQLFTTQDEVVKLADVEKFYWAVKAFNLSRMSEIYRTEIRGTAQLHLVLTAHISSLKSHAEQELREVQQGPVTMTHNTAAAMAAQNALLSSHYAQAAVARVNAGQNMTLLPQAHSGPQVAAPSPSHQLYPSPLSGEGVTHAHAHAGHNPHLLAAYAAAASGHQYPGNHHQGVLHSPPAPGHHHHQLQSHSHHPSPTSMISPQLRLQYSAGLGGKPAAAAVPHVYR